MFRRKSAPPQPRSSSSSSGGGGTTGIVGNGLGSKIGRTRSTPTALLRRQKIKGVMKFVTADDSLHSTYGSNHRGGDDVDPTSPEENSSDSSNNTLKRRISFKHIEIREYNRTIGDNPSCSSGPPVTYAHFLLALWMDCMVSFDLRQDK
jgi:hypothetical protein